MPKPLSYTSSPTRKTTKRRPAKGLDLRAAYAALIEGYLEVQLKQVRMSSGGKNEAKRQQKI